MIFHHKSLINETQTVIIWDGCHSCRNAERYFHYLFKTGLYLIRVLSSHLLSTKARLFPRASFWTCVKHRFSLCSAETGNGVQLRINNAKRLQAGMIEEEAWNEIDKALHNEQPQYFRRHYSTSCLCLQFRDMCLRVSQSRVLCCWGIVLEVLVVRARTCLSTH